MGSWVGRFIRQGLHGIGLVPESANVMVIRGRLGEGLMRRLEDEREREREDNEDAVEETGEGGSRSSGASRVALSGSGPRCGACGGVTWPFRTVDDE